MRNTEGDENGKEIGEFLSDTYLDFPSSARKKLVKVSQTFGKDWMSPFNKWLEAYGDPLESNPEKLGSMAKMPLPNPDDSEIAINTTSEEISRKLLQYYLTSFDELVTGETEEVLARTPQHSWTERRTQQNVNTICQRAWKEAWKSELRGDVLRRLELKLHFNLVAVVNEKAKANMSRIIPVVQSSGTGKSRLAEE